MSDPLPWSLTVSWSGASSAPLRLEADAQVRSRVSRFLGLEAVETLCASIAIRPWLDGLALSGRVHGLVTRLCGVSLEPFEETVDTELNVRVVPAGSPHAPNPDDGEVVIDLDGDDPPDVIDGADVDVAAYVVEALALALDPFPRKPGAVFAAPGDSQPPSPFAVLRNLNPK